MERPPWSAMQEFVGDLRRTIDNMAQTRQEMLDVTGSAWSDDNLVRAVVGPRGQLVELEIDPRIYRIPNSTALAATIVATVRAAVDDANAKSRQIMERAMPKDRGLGLVGSTDFDLMMKHHDADLPQALTRKDEEGGHGYVS